MHYMKPRNESRGGWSGGPVKDNRGDRRLAMLAFLICFAAVFAAVITMLTLL